MTHSSGLHRQTVFTSGMMPPEPLKISMKTVLVTGAAGFVGFHLSQRLLRANIKVYGVDNLNDYYDVSLKKARLQQLQEMPDFAFEQLDFSDREGMAALFANHIFDCVIHLGAQAGVRYSLTHPHAYVDSNLVGFVNILEGCRHQHVPHLVYASSSSVYGANTKVPFAVGDPVDHPVSLYAATKKANELMAFTYSHLYDIPTTGLRFFTVYGPWGRPDMAYYKFALAITQGKPIDVYNHGHMQRDFTYIDDVIEGVVRVMERPPQPQETTDAVAAAPYKIYNIGNHSPVELLRFIEVLEAELGQQARKRFLPMQPGDVVATYADVAALQADVGFQPNTSIEEGLHRFVQWFREYHP